MSADEARQLADAALIAGPLLASRTDGSKVQYLGREDFDGTLAYKLKVTQKDGDEFVYWLDPDTYLEIKVDETRRIRGAQQTTETELGDYEKVAGVYFPMSAESWREGHPNQRQRDDHRQRGRQPAGERRPVRRAAWRAAAGQGRRIAARCFEQDADPAEGRQADRPDDPARPPRRRESKMLRIMLLRHRRGGRRQSFRRRKVRRPPTAPRSPALACATSARPRCPAASPRSPGGRRRTARSPCSSAPPRAACGSRRTAERPSSRCSTSSRCKSIGAVALDPDQSAGDLGRHRRELDAQLGLDRQRRLQVDRRRRDLDQRRPARVRADHAHPRPSEERQYRLCLRARAACGRTRPTAGSTRRPTAARPGRWCSRAPTCRPAARRSPWTRRTPSICSPAPGTSAASPTTSARAAAVPTSRRAAASPRAATAAAPGPTSTPTTARACPSSRGAGSRSTMRRPTRSASMPSSRTCARRCSCPRTAAPPGRNATAARAWSGGPSISAAWSSTRRTPTGCSRWAIR